DSAFPGPSEEEPADLRRDIADELADHLETSFQNELSRTSDEGAAKAATLSRFGDPNRLAYRLWFDAMKGTIMTQRLTLAAVTAVAVASFGALFLSWISQQRMQELTRSMNESNREIVSTLSGIARTMEVSAATPTLQSPASLDVICRMEESNKPIANAVVSVD